MGVTTIGGAAARAGSEFGAAAGGIARRWGLGPPPITGEPALGELQDPETGWDDAVQGGRGRAGAHLLSLRRSWFSSLTVFFSCSSCTCVWRACAAAAGAAPPSAARPSPSSAAHYRPHKLALLSSQPAGAGDALLQNERAARASRRPDVVSAAALKVAWQRPPADCPRPPAARGGCLSCSRCSRRQIDN